jgi:hypothetical protein
MAEHGIEAYFQYACRITASRAVHRHINNGLMGFWLVIAELKGFQAVFTAIKLHT